MLYPLFMKAHVADGKGIVGRHGTFHHPVGSGGA